MSVIVPVFEQPVELAQCLDALARQTCGIETLDVIVVDNGSGPAVQEVVSRFPFARYLREPQPGSYAARNRGLDAATADVIAFTDADCIPAADWIDAGRRRIAELDRLGMIGGRIELTFTGTRPSTAAELYEAVYGFPQERYLSWGFSTTANMFTTRATFDRAGAFDARLLSGGDMEWGQRVRALGLPQIYADEVRVRHEARHRLGPLLRKARRVGGGLQRVAGLRGAGTSALRTSLRELSTLTRVRSGLSHPALDGPADRIRFATAAALVDWCQTLERLRVYLGGRATRR